MSTALFFEKKAYKNVQCRLCPHNCILAENKYGICRVRKNVNGDLATENYGLATALHLDPIEKKPLYHFYPGRKIMSLGGVGCNLSCPFCQNFEISQKVANNVSFKQELSPDQVVKMAGQYPESIGIAFTYNEPTVYYEYMFDIARKSKIIGMQNVVVSNGLINREPLEELLPYIDAFNLDIKSYSVDFYKNELNGRLAPVKESCQIILKKGKHLELTYLVVPQKNDDPVAFEKLIYWIRSKLGKNIPLHLSRYFPAYKYQRPATSSEVILKLYGIATKYLSYVYPGNIAINNKADTRCAYCGHLMITRNRYQIKINDIKPDGHCAICNHKLIVV